LESNTLKNSGVSKSLLIFIFEIEVFDFKNLFINKYWSPWSFGDQMELFMIHLDNKFS
jgi:hypothetical protein